MEQTANLYHEAIDWYLSSESRSLRITFTRISFGTSILPYLSHDHTTTHFVTSHNITFPSIKPSHSFPLRPITEAEKCYQTSHAKQLDSLVSPSRCHSDNKPRGHARTSIHPDSILACTLRLVKLRSDVKDR